MSALDPAVIAELLAKDKQRSRTKKPKKKVRDYDTWFDLHHIIDSQCSNPEHEAYVSLFDFHTLQERDEAMSPRRVVTDQGDDAGTLMCRYCFIGGWLEDA